MTVARVLGAVGRAFIAAGVLVLLFVVYQLWGTGIRQAQAQDDLREDFREMVAQARVAPTTTTPADPPATTSTTGPPPAPVPEGEATARIRIPAIGVDETVVEGVSLPALKKGPGHFPGTPLPGQEGNAAIAGHRTTYGAPFHRLDELETGDEVLVETVQGEFRYEVSEQLIVRPSQVEVLGDFDDDRLTLIACHPKYSARERIVVVAHLAPGQDPRPHPRPRREEAVMTSFEDLDGEGAPLWPTAGLGALCALIWLAAWGLGRQWRRWPAYALGLPFFLVGLFFFYEELSRVLPASY